MCSKKIYRYYLDISKLKTLIIDLKKELDNIDRVRIIDINNNLNIISDNINDYIDPRLWVYISEIIYIDSEKGDLYDISKINDILDKIFYLYRYAFYNYLDDGDDFKL